MCVRAQYLAIGAGAGRHIDNSRTTCAQGSIAASVPVLLEPLSVDRTYLVMCAAWQALTRRAVVVGISSDNRMMMRIWNLLAAEGESAWAS